jgi:hypothetical protein
MTTNTIDTSGITLPASKPTKPFAAPYVRPEKPGATGIVVPAFTPAPVLPKVREISAKTSSGEWPASVETLDAITADIDLHDPDNNGTVRAHLLIAACIERGIDAGTHIYQTSAMLGFDPSQIGKLLRLKPKTVPRPWEKGPDGRYKLI